MGERTEEMGRWREGRGEREGRRREGKEGRERDGRKDREEGDIEFPYFCFYKLTTGYIISGRPSPSN